MEYNLTNQNLGMNQGMNQNQPVDNDLTNLSESSSDFGGMQQNPNQQQAPQQNNFDNELKDNQSVSSYAGSDLSPEETLKKKRLLLFKLKRLQKKGYQPSRFYDMNSSLGELTAEVESLKREANLDQGTKVSKNALISICSLLEYVNNKFDPFDVVLDGWSEDINDDVQNGEYDEVMEEIYYKYYDKVSMGPELKLITMIGGSAVKFHLSHTLLKTMIPNAETLLKQNPGLKNEINDLIQKNIPEMNQVQNQIDNLGRGQVSGLTGPSENVDDIIAEIEKESINNQVENNIMREANAQQGGTEQEIRF
jgi:hypothetical protein